MYAGKWRYCLWSKVGWHVRIALSFASSVFNLQMLNVEEHLKQFIHIFYCHILSLVRLTVDHKCRTGLMEQSKINFHATCIGHF